MKMRIPQPPFALTTNAPMSVKRNKDNARYTAPASHKATEYLSADGNAARYHELSCSRTIESRRMAH
jgi:hypothetical protein